MRMKLIIILITCLSWMAYYDCIAQVIIRANYQSVDAHDLYNDGETDKVSGMEFGMGYWFRLKQKRLEFLPQLTYSYLSGRQSLKEIGIQLQGVIYPLDFQGDCNCPTFSKEHDLLTNGLHTGLILGGGYRWTTFSDMAMNESWNLIAPYAGLLLGLDIGLSNLLTLTPELRYVHRFGGDWSSASTTTSFHQRSHGTLMTGLRAGLRLDRKNYGFKVRRRR